MFPARSHAPAWELAEKLSFQVAIAAPDPKREAWILHGFEPRDKKEEGLLQDERKRLGFDPVTTPQRLRGDCRRRADQEDRDMKQVVERLTDGVLERQRQCLEVTPLSSLTARGQATGLADKARRIQVLGLRSQAWRRTPGLQASSRLSGAHAGRTRLNFPYSKEIRHHNEKQA